MPRTKTVTSHRDPATTPGDTHLTDLPDHRAFRDVRDVRDSRELHPRARRLRTLNSYRHAWESAPDEQPVRQWLETCWTDDSLYVNPFCDPIRGVDAFADLILDYPLLFPGFAIRAIRPVMVTQGWGQYRWEVTSWLPIRIQNTDFGSTMTGRDVVRFAADHRIDLVVTLIDGWDHARHTPCPVERLTARR